MKSLDLHGVRHSDAFEKVEDFVMNNQFRVPLSIINRKFRYNEGHGYKSLGRA